MIEVSKLYEGLRQEGLSTGIPMTFVELGSGIDYTDEELLSELIKSTKFKGEWICLLGKDTLKTGMGSFVKGLAKCLFHVEMESDGSEKDPGWFQYVDRWVVDYRPASRFNYLGLRTQDHVRFVLDNNSDIEEVKEAFGVLKNCQAVKYLKVTDASLWTIHSHELKDIVRQQDRNRIYLAFGG